MKKIVLLLIVSFFTLKIYSQLTSSKEKNKQEIFQTEKAFEKMAAKQGITEAFYFFADSMAVINRGNDSLIFGKENIRNFYLKKDYSKATVNWTPDFIDVSADGSMAYTFGKYVWKIKQDDGTIKEFRGVFHTVWKRQNDKSWKYVWD